MNHSYLCCLDYGATGEGQTNVIAHVLAPDISAATRQFVAKHMEVDTEDRIAFWSQGVRVIELSDLKTHNRAAGWLNQFLAPHMIEFLLNAEKAGALFEFYFKSYVNYS